MRGKNIGKVAAVALCACAVVAVAAALWAWHPQGAGDGEGGGTAAEAPITGSRAAPEGYDPEADEWLGASLGYVGPNGEGVVRREDYASDDEYMAASDASRFSISAEDEALLREVTGKEGPYGSHSFGKYVDSDGYTYNEGYMTMSFYRSFGEYRARQVVEEEGGVWISDTFAWDTGLEFATVGAYFPGGRDAEKAESLRARDEVMGVMRSRVGAATLDAAPATSDAEIVSEALEATGAPDAAAEAAGDEGEAAGCGKRAAGGEARESSEKRAAGGDAAQRD